MSLGNTALGTLFQSCYKTAWILWRISFEQWLALYVDYTKSVCQSFSQNVAAIALSWLSTVRDYVVGPDESVVEEEADEEPDTANDLLEQWDWVNQPPMPGWMYDEPEVVERPLIEEASPTPPTPNSRPRVFRMLSFDSESEYDPDEEIEQPNTGNVETVPEPKEIDSNTNDTIKAKPESREINPNDSLRLIDEELAAYEQQQTEKLTFKYPYPEPYPPSETAYFEPELKPRPLTVHDSKPKSKNKKKKNVADDTKIIKDIERLLGPSLEFEPPLQGTVKPTHERRHDRIRWKPVDYNQKQSADHEEPLMSPLSRKKRRLRSSRKHAIAEEMTPGPVHSSPDAIPSRIEDTTVPPEETKSQHLNDGTFPPNEKTFQQLQDKAVPPDTRRPPRKERNTRRSNKRTSRRAKKTKNSTAPVEQESLPVVENISNNGIAKTADTFKFVGIESAKEIPLPIVPTNCGTQTTPVATAKVSPAVSPTAAPTAAPEADKPATPRVASRLASPKVSPPTASTTAPTEAPTAAPEAEKPATSAKPRPKTARKRVRFKEEPPKRKLSVSKPVSSKTTSLSKRKLIAAQSHVVRGGIWPKRRCRRDMPERADLWLSDIYKQFTRHGKYLGADSNALHILRETYCTRCALCERVCCAPGPDVPMMEAPEIDPDVPMTEIVEAPEYLMSGTDQFGDVVTKWLASVPMGQYIDQARAHARISKLKPYVLEDEPTETEQDRGERTFTRDMYRWRQSGRPTEDLSQFKGSKRWRDYVINGDS